MTETETGPGSGSGPAADAGGPGGAAAPEASVAVSRTVEAPVERVWEALNSAAGTQALLGSGARLGGKGEPWHSEEGPHGVLRSHHPLEQIRVSWHARPEDPATLIDLRLHAEAGGTRVDLSHEHLPAGADPESLRRHWEESLDRLAATAAT